MDEIITQQGQEMETRPIEVITAEIWLYKNQAGAAILEIGRRLIEAKAQLSHGEWLPFLEEKVDFSEASAQRFMRLAREYENPSPVTDLGASKALVLLALPASERDDFVAEKHLVNGEEKTVAEMSKRELEKAIKERDKARYEAENARADAARAVDEREKMASDMAVLKQMNETAEEELRASEKLRADLVSELEAMKSRPKEVAVEKVVDQQAIDKAAADARKAAEEDLQKKIQKAEKAKETAEKAKAAAEQEMAAAKIAAEQAATVAEKEKQAMAEQVQDLRKKLAVASSSEMTIFKLHFEQGQASINKMAECIGKMEEAGDAAGAAKLKNALRALLNSTLEVLA